MKVWAVETVVTSMILEDTPMNVMKSTYFGLFKELKDARKSVEEWYAKDHPGKKIFAVGKGWSTDEDDSVRGFFIVREVIDGEEMGQEAHCVSISQYKVE